VKDKVSEKVNRSKDKLKDNFSTAKRGFEGDEDSVDKDFTVMRQENRKEDANERGSNPNRS